ncbi:MAG: methyltransferase domain-containing protein [Flavobacterium sp.]
MNILVETTYRTTSEEIMDDFSLAGEELREALDKIGKINQFLGGNSITLAGIKSLLKNQDTSKTLRIIDIGCGNGDMLRTIAQYGLKKKLNFDLIGIDANAFTISHASDLSKNFKNIRYSCENIFDPKFSQYHCDVFLCTLTLHHFEDADVNKVLKLLYEKARFGMVINDLQRSGIAYRLFQLLCIVFRLNNMSRQDGLTSILRGFKEEELLQFSKKINPKSFSIKWKWAFRYQWIISKI